VTNCYNNFRCNNNNKKKKKKKKKKYEIRNKFSWVDFSQNRFKNMYEWFQLCVCVCVCVCGT